MECEHIILIIVTLVLLFQGPYLMELEKFEVCKGPKQTECGKFEIKNSQNMSDVVFLLDFPRDCPATSVGILIKILQKKKLFDRIF